jgi:Zn-dependent protease with chaperone function
VSDQAAETERDPRLVGFLTCMLAVTVVAVIGGEVRILVKGGDAITASTLGLAFLVACLLVRKLLIDWAMYRPRVLIDQKWHRVELRPAHDRVQAYVRERARELGFKEEIELFYLPGTWRAVDAYVLGIGRHQAIVVSGGLQALFLLGRPDDLDRFRFVIDHELGHIASADTSLLYLARAILICAILFLPVKALFALMFGSRIIIAAYSQMLPIFIFDSFFGRGATVLAGPPSELFVMIFFLLFTTGSLIMIGYFYIAIVRHREILADRFAYRHSADPAKSRSAMESVLDGRPLAASPPHGFLGSLRWHPKTSERIRSLGASAIASIPDHIGIVMVVLALLSFRLVLGDITSPREDAGAGGDLVPLAAIFALLVGFVVNCFISSERGPAPQALAVMVVWTALASAALSVVVLMLSQPGWLVAARLDGFEHLVTVEVFERILLIVSAPVTIAVFGFCHCVVPTFSRRGMAFTAQLLRNVAVAAVSVLVLWILGDVTGHFIKQYRMEKYEAYKRTRIEVVSANQKTTEKNSTDAEQSVDRFMSFGSRQSEYEHYPPELLNAEIALMHGRVMRAFNPPFAFIALWQAPLRGMGIW